MELKTVRERGIPAVQLEEVPSLREALSLHRRGLPDESRRYYLRELLADAADQLDDHNAEGIRLGLDIYGEGGSSAERRERMALHYGRTAETLRKKRGEAQSLEEQKLTELAKAILRLVGASSSSPDNPQDGVDTSESPQHSRDEPAIAPAQVLPTGEASSFGVQRIVLGAPAAVAASYQRRAFDDRIEQAWADGTDRRLWLRGLPGIGKSYAARRVMQKAITDQGADREYLLIWVDAADAESVKQTFSDAVDQMPTRLGLSVSVEVHDRVERQAKNLLDVLAGSGWRWLVVLDNADAGSLINARMIPSGQNPNGRVLITTLGRDSRIADNGQVFLAEAFTPHEADRFIRAQRDPRNGGSAAIASRPENERAALANEVFRHPLALSIAAATIVANDMLISEWITDFRSVERLDVAADEPDRGGYPHLIGSTWQVALEKASRGLPDGVASRAALVAAVLDPAGHPTWLWQSKAVASWVGGDATLARHHGRPVAVRNLIDHGILDLAGPWTGGRLAIHQLAARAVREPATPDELAEVTTTLVTEWLLHLTDDESEARSDLRRNLQHLLKLPGVPEEARRMAWALLEFPGRPSRTSLTVDQRSLDLLDHHLRSGGVTGRAYVAGRLVSIAARREELEQTVEAEADYLRAAEEYQQCIADPSASDDERAEWLTLLGRVYDRLGRQDTAQESRASAAKLYQHLLDTDLSIIRRLRHVNSLVSLYGRLGRAEDKRDVLDRNRQILQAAQEGLSPLTDNAEDHKALLARAAHAAAYGKFLENDRQIEQAVGWYTQAGELRRRVRPAMARDLELRIARLRIAAKRWADAESLLKRLKTDNPKDVAALVLHASVLMQLGHADEAEDDLHAAADQYKERQLEAELTEPIDPELLVRMYTDPTPSTKALKRLSRDATHRGRWEEAAGLNAVLLHVVQELSEASPDHESQLAAEYLKTGISYMMANRSAEAHDYLLCAARISQTLSELEPAQRAHAAGLAIALTQLGTLDLVAGHAQDAEDSLARAVAIFERLAGQNPEEDRMHQILLANALTQLGTHYLGTDRTQDAEDSLVRAVSIFEHLVVAPQNPEDHMLPVLLTPTLLGWGLTLLGMHYLETDRTQDAEDSLIRAADLLEQLADQNPEGHMLQALYAITSSALGWGLTMLGMQYLEADRMQDAEVTLIRAVELLEQLADRNLEDHIPLVVLANTPSPLGWALGLLGGLYKEAGRGQDAEDILVRAADLLEQLADQDPEGHDLLVAVLEELAELYHQQGRSQDAENALTRVASILQPRAGRNPEGHPHA